jgi:hypothetical protein
MATATRGALTFTAFSNRGGSTQSATRTDEANPWALYAVWTPPTGDLTTMTPSDPAEVSVRERPATMEALLAWGRRILRTGAKKIDLDL